MPKRDIMSEEIKEIRDEVSTVAVKGVEMPRDSMKSRHNRSQTSTVTYMTMLCLLFLGLLTAVGHHLFYLSLEDREIEEAAVTQNWVIRIGNTFAYLFKTWLSSAVALAYAQGFWYFVRRRSFEIGLLDRLFGVLYNPLSFLSKDLFQKTFLLCGLAAVAWLLPLSAVFAPGALTSYYPCSPNLTNLVTTVEKLLVMGVTVPILAPLDHDIG